MPANHIKALMFDVFGTVVDWRSSVVREATALAEKKGLDGDWEGFADDWRGLYQPMMAKVREGEMGWTDLDTLHRMGLDTLLASYGLEDLSEPELEHLTRAWQRLDPWPEAVTGMNRLKSRYIVAALSNGHIALIVNMAKRAGIPWDVVLGAEVASAYKPQPAAYLGSVAALKLEPEQCLMVATHDNDLAAAAACGLATAYVHRRHELGPSERKPGPSGSYDFVAEDFNDLADQLGCS